MQSDGSDAAVSLWSTDRQRCMNLIHLSGLILIASSSQVTIICIALLTMQIVSKQLDIKLGSITSGYKGKILSAFV